MVIIKKKKMKHHAHRGHRGHHYGWQKKKRHHRGATVIVRRLIRGTSKAAPLAGPLFFVRLLGARA